jgi:hypothetical protein
MNKIFLKNLNNDNQTKGDKQMARLTNKEFKSLHGIDRNKFELYICIFSETGLMVKRDDCGEFTLNEAKKYILNKKDNLLKLNYKIWCHVPNDDTEEKANRISNILTNIIN